jgi:hypothetical protein
MKPIRAFYSHLSGRFYASRAYKQVAAGAIAITGQKFDVTDDIGAAVEKHDLTFSQSKQPEHPNLP